jgi:hypothetical protein
MTAQCTDNAKTKKDKAEVRMKGIHGIAIAST